MQKIPSWENLRRRTEGILWKSMIKIKVLPKEKTGKTLFPADEMQAVFSADLEILPKANRFLLKIALTMVRNTHEPLKSDVQTRQHPCSSPCQVQVFNARRNHRAI